MLGEQGNTEQQNEGVHPLALSPSNQQVQQSSPEGGGDVEGRQSPAAALEPALQRSLQGSRYAQGRQDAGMGGPGQGYVQTKAMSQPPRPGANPVQKKHSTLPGSDQFALQLRESAGAPDLASVHSQAEQGVSGGGGALPHGGQIQDAFGHHDVSGVGAHVGGKAKEAGEAIGAQAYARGDQVAFNESPGLHTAAHEAAHVVQQRSGVQLDGGVGQAGDSYEQHADAVADKVVAGESAQGLLDEMSGGGDEGGGVQAKTEKSAPKASETPTESVDIAKLTKDLQKVQKDSAELTALADSWYQQSVSGNVKATKESTPDGAQSAATMDTLITKSAVDVGYASEADASQSPGVSSKADAEHHSPMVPEAFKVDPRDVSAAPVVDPSTPTMGSKAAMSNVVATGKGVETVWQAVDGAKADGVERAKRIGESAADQLEVMGVARPTIATADQDGGSFRDSNWTLTVGTQGGNQIYGPTADSAAAAKGAPAATTGAADATATDANSTSSGADSGASTAADSGSTSSASPTPKAEAPAASKAPPASSATPSYSAEKAQRVARVVNTVVHEARHAEQKHAVIRHYLQNPRSNEELQKRWEEIAAAARSKGATEEQIQQTLSEVGLRKDSWKDEAQAIQFAKHALAYKPEAIDAAAKAGGIPVHKESESLWERVRGILGMDNSSTTEATETPEGHT
ncbi:MAG TPA: hypothetical protein DCQ06_13890, partial [Myxococcales bacterium]|nr:hypothetical protein [Myxococcales bacterium]